MKNIILFSLFIILITINISAFAMDEESLDPGHSGTVSSVRIQQTLANPDRTFDMGGRKFKILNLDAPRGLLEEMSQSSERIKGSPEPWGRGWEFSYVVPGTYDESDQVMWSLHPSYAGQVVDFQVEEVIKIGPSPSHWYDLILDYVPVKVF